MSVLATDERPAPGWAMVCLALLLLAVGARLNALGLVPFVALSLAILAVRYRTRWMLVMLAAGLGFCVAALVLVARSPAPWAETLRGRWMESPRLELPAALTSIGRSFVGEFGWMDVPLHGWAYVVAATAAAALLLLVMVQLSSRRRPGRQAAVLLALAGLSMFVAVVGDALLSGQAQGRYLFPALASLAALAGLGGCGLLGARTGLRVAGLAGILLVAGNLYALLGRVAPAYLPAASGMLSTTETADGEVLVQHGLSTSPDGGFAPDALGRVIVAAPEASGVELTQLLVQADETRQATLCRGQRAVPAPWVLHPGDALVLQMPGEELRLHLPIED